MGKIQKRMTLSALCEAVVEAVDEHFADMFKDWLAMSSIEDMEMGFKPGKGTTITALNKIYTGEDKGDEALNGLLWGYSEFVSCDMVMIDKAAAKKACMMLGDKVWGNKENAKKMADKMVKIPYTTDAKEHLASGANFGETERHLYRYQLGDGED